MQKFLFQIDAESPNGEAIKCDTKVKIACDSSMAIAIIANIFCQDASIKRLFSEALLISVSTTKEEICTEMKDEDYYKHFNKNNDDVVDF